MMGTVEVVNLDAGVAVEEMGRLGDWIQAVKDAMEQKAWYPAMLPLAPVIDQAQ